MSLENTITDLIDPILDDLGFVTVQVRIMGGYNPTIQIMIDRLDETLTTVDDCATASRAISAMMDVEDPIDNAYTLEVSTPGIDRPLVRLRDFERYTTMVVKIECHAPIDGKRKIRGVITATGDNSVTVQTDTPAPNNDNGDHDNGDTENTNEINIDLDNIKLAKLVMNDDLVKFSRALYGMDNSNNENSA